MANYLVINEEFYPYTNASTNCLEKILQELTTTGNSVTVMSCAYDEAIPEKETYQGYTIRRIHAPKKVLECFYKFPFPNEKIFKKITGTLTIVWGRVTNKFKYIKLYNKLKKDKCFDYIISIHCPQRNHNLAFLLADKKTKWILYYFDPLVYNSEFGGKAWYKKLKEKLWDKKAYRVICVEGILEENCRNGYKSFKTTPKLSLPLPNFKIDNTQFTSPDNSDKIILRYTGSFYKKIRNPDYLITLLENLDPQKYIVEFYGYSCYYLKSITEKLPDCISIKEDVSIEDCHKIVETADILINVGNKCTNQIPSKIFEYIATGKPIINIYYDDNDPSLPYFQKYPVVLNIKQGETTDIDVFETFCSTAKPVSKDMILDLYKDVTTANIVKKFCDFVES